MSCLTRRQTSQNQTFPSKRRQSHPNSREKGRSRNFLSKISERPSDGCFLRAAECPVTHAPQTAASAGLMIRGFRLVFEKTNICKRAGLPIPIAGSLRLLRISAALRPLAASRFNSETGLCSGRCHRTEPEPPSHTGVFPGSGVPYGSGFACRAGPKVNHRRAERPGNAERGLPKSGDPITAPTLA